MMTIQEQYIAHIKKLVIKQYGSNISSADDCAALSDAVEKSVGTRIDMPTLQMLFSRGSGMVAPRPMVLTALAKYVGYDDWANYCASCNINADDSGEKIPVSRRWGVIIAIAAVVILLVAGGVYLFMSKSDDAKQAPVPTAYDNIVEDVKAKYLTLVDEQCVELRVYDSTNRLALESQVDEVVQNYRDEVCIAIAADIRVAADAEGVDVDDATIEASAADISEQCIGIINELLEE